MVRTCLCSLVGAGVGFALAFVLVMIIFGDQPARDTAAVTVFLGALLAVGGAIAGALIGGAADLLQYFRKRDEAAREARGQGESESRV